MMQLPVCNSKLIINSWHSVPYDLQLEILILIFFLYIYGTLKTNPKNPAESILQKKPSQRIF